MSVLHAVKEKCWIVSSLEEVEWLGGDNKYLCSECLHHTEADRSVTYQQLPHILTIHIKRFAGFVHSRTLTCMTPSPAADSI